MEVGTGARFVTCRHCNSSLEIKRSDSAEWTELLQQVSQQTGKIQSDLDAIKAEQELERLEREWEREREANRTEERTAGAEAKRGSGFAGLFVLGIVGAFLLCGGLARRGSLSDNGEVLGLICAAAVLLPMIALGFFLLRPREDSHPPIHDRELSYLQKREELLARVRRKKR